MEFGLQDIHNALDKKAAETDSSQPSLRIGDRIKDRSISVVRVDDRRFFVQKLLHIPSETVHQGDFDENQRLVRH